LEAPDEHVQNRLGLEDRFMKWAIREKIGAGFGLALLILVLIGVVSYRSTAQLIETGRLVAQTHELLGALESVRARMTEIETGARGYVITGDDRYLEPYYAARAEIDQDIKDLGHLVADDRDQQEYFDTLAALIAERMGLSMAMVDLRQQGGGEPARQMVLMDQGKLVMDTIRVVITAAENEGEALLRQRDEEAHQRAHDTTVTIVVGSLLALTLVAVATVIINRDITGLQRTEEALRKSEELYHTLVKNFPNGWVLLFDHDLRYTIADGAGLAAISLSKEAFEGKTIWEALPPETCALIEPHYRAALAGEARSFELLYANRAHLVYTLPIRNESGQIYAGMMMSQDITQRKEVERLKDEFLSTVSHELRTPLSSTPSRWN
jgi:CHASE3 domain sensor protein